MTATSGEALKTRKPIHEPSEGGCISFLFDEGSEQRILNDANEAFHICRRLKTAQARENLLEYARGLETQGK
uniref:hypothetical protein n=1 Tax=Methylobacterium oryzae TaxID=334852 RepID=UPI000A5871EF|nr:hypothetical protein [Methylobacterium oryzae]